MKNFVSAGLFVLVLVLVSCNNNKLDIDVSGIEVKDFEITRFEKELFGMNPDSLNAQTEHMLNKHGNFYLSFVTQIINDGGIKDSSYNYNLQRFITDKDMLDVYHECEKAYPDMNNLKAGLTDVFKHYQYYFPRNNLPKVLTYMSGFNYAVSYSDNTVGIGLEMYLGRNNKFYKLVQFPNYKTMTMTQEYMLSDCVKGWASAVYEPEKSKDDFLSQIVHMGKVLYFMDAMMPFVDDTIKIGYTQKQMEWCKLNEYNMWAYFIENKMLYITNSMDIMKYTSEGPFTAAFNKESPSRVGHWIGWQIVRAYMNNNPEITLVELMEQKDCQKIFTLSKYKPEK